jgi:hemolysin III
VNWGLALLGFLIQFTPLRRIKFLELGLYVGMGWVVVVAIKPMIGAVPAPGLLLLFLGGIAYTGGVVFYVWKRLPYHHAVWHVFVLAGSLLHFFSVLFFVLPPR